MESGARVAVGKVEAFANATVGVAGLGGLGSHIAISLARAGVGHLVLVDFDLVDRTNLNRQYYTTGDIGLPKTEALAQHIHAVSPDTRLTKHKLRVTEDNLVDLFDSCSVVVEAFDQVASKTMILRAFGRAPLRDIPLVAASGVAGIGSANDIVTRRLTGNVYVCGDSVSDVELLGKLLAPRVMVVAGHQALQVLRILAGLE